MIRNKTTYDHPKLPKKCSRIKQTQLYQIIGMQNTTVQESSRECHTFPTGPHWHMFIEPLAWLSFPTIFQWLVDLWCVGQGQTHIISSKVNLPYHCGITKRQPWPRFLAHGKPQPWRNLLRFPGGAILFVADISSSNTVDSGLWREWHTNVYLGCR